MPSEDDRQKTLSLSPVVKVAGVSRGAAEVPPLLGAPVSQLGRLRAPVINGGREELVEQHTPGVGQLQEGEQNTHKNLVPDSDTRYLYWDVNKVLAKEMSFFVCIQQTKVWWLNNVLSAYLKNNLGTRFGTHLET